MANTDADLARRLVTAIDELLAFVEEHSAKSKSEMIFLTAKELQKLFDLEGTVVGLHAIIANGRLPFQNPATQATPASGFRIIGQRTQLTGLDYFIGREGMRLTPSYEWQTKMYSLRAAAQAIVGVETAAATGIGGQRDNRPDTKKKTRIRGPRDLVGLIALKRAIAQGAKQGLTEIESAVEFTDGDEKRAQSLLRTLRRYRNHPGLP